MAKYLVTGGAGFIGSHLVEELIKKGDEVRVLDNLSTGKKENITPFLHQIEFVEGDIRDEKVCAQCCREIDYVLHQGALGSVPRSIEDPKTTNDVNITGTLNMLMAAREAKVKRFVFASSSSIYGDSPTLPKKESMLPNPLSPYALSKYTAEVYTCLFYKLYQLETVALRYFNVFGPHQDPYSQYAAVIPRFIDHFSSGKPPIIYGDGKQSRDFTFVKDAVSANLAACVAHQKACGQTYNIACNKKITINDLFYSIRHLMAQKNLKIKNIEPIYEPPRVGDVKESLADISKASEYLKFRPHYELQEGLKETV